MPKTVLSGTAISRRQQGQLDRGQRIRIDDGGKRGTQSLGQRFAEHDQKRQDQKQRNEQNRDGAQRKTQQRRIVGGGAAFFHRRFAAQICKPFKASSITNDAASITTPIEAAPA